MKRKSPSLSKSDDEAKDAAWSQGMRALEREANEAIATNNARRKSPSLSLAPIGKAKVSVSDEKQEKAEAKTEHFTVTSTDVANAMKAMSLALVEYFPSRAFLSVEGGGSELCDVYGFAVVGRHLDHDGWRGPTVAVVSREAGPGYDEQEETHMLISGRDALVQLRAAIDHALGDRP